MKPSPEVAGRGGHPEELELRHYVRGTLAPGHAIAILAHCVVCVPCGDRLEQLLARDGVGEPGRFRQPGRWLGGS